MTRNLAATTLDSPPASQVGRSLVLVGLMGAGKTAIGRRLAARLGWPFCDSDTEIEKVAGYSIAELFTLHGEASFREGERRVVQRLLTGPPIVLATGGGAFMDPATRATVRQEAVSVWLRCDLPTLVRRVAHRSHRPLLVGANPAAVLQGLIEQRHATYAEADVIVDCNDDSPEATTDRVAAAIAAYQPALQVQVRLAERSYPVLIGAGLVGRAGALLAPVLPQKRVAIVTDSNVARLHLAPLRAGLAETGITVLAEIVVPAGEGSKSLSQYGAVVDALLAGGIERRGTVVALGGGVVGDLAGFAAATVLRGVGFVQIPTSLLAQVDASVGGKTGINTGRGKNLLGAFYQPLMVLADTAMLATLPARELRAGYAEIVKTGLIGDADFYAWCERHGGAVVAGDVGLQAEAVRWACAFKAAVVGDDERELRANDGRALLNLGHTFGHALEAAIGYGGILHGEAVAIGLGLAFRLSARLGLCDGGLAPRIEAHLESVGLPPRLDRLNRRLSASGLMGLMGRDKKARDGRVNFVLTRGIGQAFTTDEVSPDTVLETLREAGCAP